MQLIIGDIIAVAEAGAEFRTAVPHAGVMIRAFDHVDAPDAFAGLYLFRGKACALSEHLACPLDKQSGDQAVNARKAGDFLKRPLQLPRTLFHIIMNRFQRFVFGHHVL